MIQDVVPDILCLFISLCLGSFATALTYRLPRGVSMLRQTRSACPSCDHTLGVSDLVPIFSWLCLRGRCRYCQTAIGWRYPLIEFSTVILSYSFFMLYGWTVQMVGLFALATVLVAIIAIDLGHKLIPDVLNGAVGFSGVFVLLTGPNPMSQGADACLGTVLYGGFALALRAFFFWRKKKEALGGGDVKFFAAVGFWLGLEVEAVTLFLLLSGVFGVALALLWEKVHHEKDFPFGPALVAAFIVCIFVWRPFIG